MSRCCLATWRDRKERRRRLGKKSSRRSRSPEGDFARFDVAKTEETSEKDRTIIQPSAGEGGAEHPAEHKLRLIQLIGEKTIRTVDSGNSPRKCSPSPSSTPRRCGEPFACLKRTAPMPTGDARLFRRRASPMSRTVLKRLLEERSGVLIREETSCTDAALMSLKNMSVDSHLCVPLWTTDKIMGFISLDRQGGRSFTEAQLDLLIAIGHQTAIGVERGRMAALAVQEQNVRSYLSQYLDGKLVQQIAKQSKSGETGGVDPLAPAEREVTVLFSDIVSFTKISEALQPTELSRFIRDYLTAMTDIIFSHGGTIDKYIGDAVMALFGAPVSSPDAPHKAIAAALEMRDYVAEMTPRARSRTRCVFASGSAPARPWSETSDRCSVWNTPHWGTR